MDSDKIKTICYCSIYPQSLMKMVNKTNAVADFDVVSFLFIVQLYDIILTITFF